MHDAQCHETATKPGLGCAQALKAAAPECDIHTFEPQPYRPTTEPQQLFWRYHDEVQGRDILVEIEDMPGLDKVDDKTGELTAEAELQLATLLKPLLWFEKYKRDKDTKERATPATNDWTMINKNNDNNQLMITNNVHSGA